MAVAIEAESIRDLGRAFVDLGGGAAERMVAARGIRELDLDFGIGYRRAHDRLDLGGRGIEGFTRQKLADQRKRAALRHRDVAAAAEPGDQQEAAADQFVFGSRRNFVGMLPQGGHRGMACAQGILPEFRHAEISRLAGDGYVGDEESDLRRIDRKTRRLDINGEIGSRHLAGLDTRGKILDAGRNPCARLAALLVADEGKGHVAGKADAGLVEQRQCGQRSTDARLQVARTAPPDGTVDDWRAEGILALAAGPVLAPAIDMDGIGMADEQQSPAFAGSLPFGPDVGAARQEFGGAQACHPKRAHLLFEIGDEVRLVAGDAFAPDGAAEKLYGLVAVERIPQADGQVVRQLSLRSLPQRADVCRRK